MKQYFLQMLMHYKSLKNKQKLIPDNSLNKSKFKQAICKYAEFRIFIWEDRLKLKISNAIFVLDVCSLLVRNIQKK